MLYELVRKPQPVQVILINLSEQGSCFLLVEVTELRDDLPIVFYTFISISDFIRLVVDCT